jgi:hypothetical protein
VAADLTVLSVAEVTEAECRRIMAMRAAIKLQYDTRLVRRDLMAEACALLDEYNLLTLGR